ncbi:MAG TPA: hypothetical protein VFF75_12450, partial [Methylophilaceae bacterium]|nr:hypothetical protein [Methylophilaceae bacterium]
MFDQVPPINHDMAQLRCTAPRDEFARYGYWKCSMKGSSMETYQGISPRIGSEVYIHPSASVIGDVELGDDASIWPGTV